MFGFPLKRDGYNPPPKVLPKRPEPPSPMPPAKNPQRIEIVIRKERF
jgi:hypothetical protein